MDQIIPWRDLCKVIKPFYPKVKRKGAGRPAVGLELMLRIHFLTRIWGRTAVFEIIGSTTRTIRFW